ncbi:helicase family protein [Pleurotus pulmonarius]
MESDLHSNLIPRKYQEEIFIQAQDRNIIAALGTGSGKTLIGALLLKWMALKDTRSRTMFFLVPKVALVEQQGKYLKDHTPFKVKLLYGSMDIDLADRQGWQACFEQHELFVMTAQIFLNFLAHSIWSIDKTSIIIFDECHHARKKHAYNQITNGFYFHTPVDQRPKIFGMTASPIWDTKDATGSLATLERNLDAIVIGVKEHLTELEHNVPKPNEVIEVFRPASNTHFDTHDLYNTLNVFSDLLSSQETIEWVKVKTRYQSALSNLGHYCAEVFLFNEMDFRVAQVIGESTVGSEICADYVSLPGLGPKSLHPDMLHVQAIIDDFRPFFNTSGVSPSRVPLNDCTPKLSKLVEILLSFTTGVSMAFQAIIFVEQRHVASCLAHILPCIDGLGGWLKPGLLLGEGAGLSGAPKMVSSFMGGEWTAKKREETLAQFRSGEINILVATSVAEEGLHFPDCSLVIRYDPLQHLVGYVQSRGRARNMVASTFVVMIQEDDTVQLGRYRRFLDGEPEVKKLLNSKRIRDTSTEDDDDDEESDAVYELNLQSRERYVVPGTGATLNYDNAINLLNHLCALIPCDAFTPTHIPKYEPIVTAERPVADDPLLVDVCGYGCTLRLPPSLPLPPKYLTFSGPVKLSKKEAKRAVAFKAVKALREFEVFDAYLLPTSKESSKRGRKGTQGKSDVDGRGYVNVGGIPPMMNVGVRNPWHMGSPSRGLSPSGCEGRILWLHAVWINGTRSAGVVSEVPLPSCEAWTQRRDFFRMNKPRPLDLRREIGPSETEEELCEWMAKYTTSGIWYRVMGRPVDGHPSFYVVPLVAEAPYPRVDFRALCKFAAHPYGNTDWSEITLEHYGHLFVMNNNQHGRPYLLRRIRHDLSPQTSPPPGSREDAFPTFYEYWIDRWKRKKREAQVPEDGPLIEVYRLPRYRDSKYYQDQQDLPEETVYGASDGAIIPQGSCAWLDLPQAMLKTFEILPILAHRIIDVYRARCARLDFGLPAIRTNLQVEAFTVPSTDAPYSNQRLETLGDSVLKLCVTVHAFNKYPHRHEGQLSALRQSTISNQCLMARAKEVGLESYLISEQLDLAIWPHSQGIRNKAEALGIELGSNAHKRVSRIIARRSLQDCMEATLGAAFATAGIPMALQAGDAIGLSFGGIVPWPMRYEKHAGIPGYVASPLFSHLQEMLGYTFRRTELVAEAMTHPSFASEVGGPSYQRLEFLGDAVLDLIVVSYLYDKFPKATSHQLSFPRTRAICSTALAWVAVNRLQLHKVMLINNVELSMLIAQYVPLLEDCPAEDIVRQGWKYEPPKAISDVFEGLLGAILIDTDWDYEKTAVITENIMEDVLTQLSPTLQLYPGPELTTWVAMSGCRGLEIRKSEKHGKGERVSIVIHGTTVSGPITSPSFSLAKNAACARALDILRDPSSDKSLSRLCTCKQGGMSFATRCEEENSIDESEAEEEEVERILLAGLS